MTTLPDPPSHESREHSELSDNDRHPRLLAVVAHPDDETFGCGSLLLHAASSGMVTAVVCATRGEAGEVAGDLTGDLATVREAETRKAAEVLGVSDVTFLDLLDSGMSGDAGPHTLIGASASEVSDQVREQIEAFRPDVVVTLDGSDGHRDHVCIRDATLAAADTSSWAVERVYLHCLPQSLMRRWFQHMAATDPSWEHLQGDVPGTPEHEITTVIDTAEHLARREQAIATHRSQRSPFEGLPDDLRQAFLTRDSLRRVRPAWMGGTTESALLLD
ncbi:MAG: PIG-L family deacetylase [Ornithinimicrobium sp.]